MRAQRIISAIAATLLFHTPAVWAAAANSDADQAVSYFEQVRPIFQAHCQGCHQPAKAKGGYVMTDFARLLSAGDSGDAAIVPGKPEASYLVQQITPVDGEAEMPQGKPPLNPDQIELIRRWIAAGAKDDSPPGAQPFDMDNPPVYSRLPVITSLDYSPDGSLLAVSGFHEVLLHQADGSGLAGRLVGLSERIQSVRFSPDGTMLAVAGGQPARMGEVQVWDVEKRQLIVSVPITYDTTYGVNWSPDGTLVSFGCADNTVRAINAKTGKQVLQQGSHDDWVLDTAFSAKGDHLISVGRDMSAKLTELATQRFIDNITSITPGALRVGIHTVSRHPERDEILIGGADGLPQIYRVFRQTERRIGDNAALVRKFPPMAGRIFSVDYSPDGNRIAAGATLDGHGSVNVYCAGFDSSIPTNIVAIFKKRVMEQTADDKTALEKFFTSDVQLIASLKVPNAGVYAVSFSPDGQFVAAGGTDGQVRVIDSETGLVAKEFSAAPISRGQRLASPESAAPAPSVAVTAEPIQESLPPGAVVTRLEVLPASITLSSRNEETQVIVLAHLNSGDTADVTRLAQFRFNEKLGDISPQGRLAAKRNGAGKLRINFAGQRAVVPVEIAGVKHEFEADFVRDINPSLTKLGCNQGSCHGSADGKNGFKLSLRGYDPLFDVRAIADDLAARRVNIASPDDSLMLLKAIAAVPHEGGQRTTMDSKYYQILRQWIASGAALDEKSPRVARIEIFPKNPVVQQIGSKQQMRVVATYADGRTRDVTAQAFVESGNVDIVNADADGLISTLRRGEAPVLARYEGAYAATTITVMGDRSGFVWQEPPAYNRVDELVAAKWQRMKILPSDTCDDYEFIRRAYLDLTGLPPTPEAVRKFVSDSRDQRIRRDELIDRLVGSEPYVEHWANKWADLLQVNRKFLGEEGTKLFRDWIRGEVADNSPYNQFVHKIVTASGSNRENPAASYFKVLRTPEETMENTTHLFLGTRFNCNKCHDHPFERWTQDQYYQLAAFFAQTELKRDPESGNRNVGGSAVEGAKPLFEIVADRGQGEMKHERTGQIAAPEFPYPVSFRVPKAEPVSRRGELAAWLTSEDNRYFATSYVNRLWGYLMGVGLIEPLDDIRAGNPPTNPELLEYLTSEFIQGGFNVQHLIKLICKSRTYQLSIATHEWNADDEINYSHALARRLPAEVLLDTVFAATGSVPKFPGVKPGTRAAELPDSSIDPGGFLANLGRPPRESACECERSNEIRLGAVMSLLSGPVISGAVNDPENAIAKLVAREKDDAKLVEEIFLRMLNRPATEREMQAALYTVSSIEPEHSALLVSLEEKERWWAPIYEARQREREENIAQAKANLAAYEEEIRPKVEAAESERLRKIEAAEKAVADYAPTLAANLNEWEKTLAPDRLQTAWVPLEAKDVKATAGATLAKQKDGSILARIPGNGLPDYTVTVDTALTNITGVMLEVLPDISLPAFGPGGNKGNFVLSEFKLSWSVAKNPNRRNATAVKFTDARADHSQKDFNVKTAIDGQVAQGAKNGWAIAGKPFGQPRWATFQLDQPIGDEQGATLTFTLQHKYQGGFGVGRFRLWVTTADEPLNQGLPEAVTQLVSVPADERTAEQSEALLAYYRGVDLEHIKRDQSRQTARQPLPTDPGVIERRNLLAKASEPVRIDPAVVQLREDVELSKKQVANPRLTGAQDLAWALINNPAFLFNR